MQNSKLQFKIQNLRKRYPKFIYKNYSYRISKNNLEILFSFEIEPDIHFQPKVVIENINKSRATKMGDRVLKNLIFNLGLMEIPSYWKATCSPEIEILAGYLNPEQIRWWKDLIMNGMGQFFYENKIDFTKPDFLQIIVPSINMPRSVLGILKDEVLVPVGGGKDSIVTLERLKKRKKRIGCFLVNPTKAAKSVIKVAGIKNPIIVRRTIDPKLLGLNKRGYLNGHTPITAVLSLLSVFCAILFDYKYIAFSNEKSANEGNVKYLGKMINHQWSKSSEFEKKFRFYIKKYLTPGVEYFSFLRKYTELEIAKMFTRYPKYFPVFSSCNVVVAQKLKKRWCGKCPKCLFAFSILYPFLNEKALIKIFGKNLFEDKDLLPIMRQLIGVGSPRGFKPFECVGTKKESLVAFYLSYKKCIGDTYAKLPVLLKYFKEKILPKYPNLKKESIKIISPWNNQHNLPKEFEKVLRKTISQ